MVASRRSTRTTLAPERFEPTVESPKKRKQQKGSRKRKGNAAGSARTNGRGLMRASRAAGLPPASPMADRTNNSRRGGFDALSPIGQDGNTSFNSVFGGRSPGVRTVDPSKVRERGVELVGWQVLKQFGAAKGKFCGTIVSVDEEQTPRTYLVRYEDGDEEDVVERELLECLIGCRQPEMQRSRSSVSTADTSTSSERSRGPANGSGRSVDKAPADFHGSQGRAKKKRLAKQAPRVRRMRETKSMQLKREAATKRFITNRKHYFSQLDELELECE